MKIAVSATGKTLADDVDPRFGRAAFFLLVDSESMEIEVVENTQNLNLPQGAGIQAGKTIIDSQAEILITGNCGPKAFKVLDSAGIKILTGASGSVDNALRMYKNGELESATEPSVEGHWV